jgi:hypothetical protein
MTLSSSLLIASLAFKTEFISATINSLGDLDIIAKEDFLTVRHLVQLRRAGMRSSAPFRKTSVFLLAIRLASLRKFGVKEKEFQLIRFKLKA